jgi:3',5'-cyclic AMP phosphodiesterase CpdA
LVHFSDIHITAKALGWQRRDWFSKRLTGWINYRWLGRARRFRHADEVLAALMTDLSRRRPDHLVFCGDATALGFEAEFTRAATLLDLNTLDGLPGLAVPGNHDYYTRGVEAAGLFERYFASWQTGERVDEAVYPFAQRVGPLWLVAVNTAAANVAIWDASGRVDPGQLERLERLLKRLGPGPRILVTHYPVCLASGKRERRTHGLRNLAELVGVAARGGVGLWLHGHRHGSYWITESDLAPFPIICAGSATQQGLWSYGDYAITGCRVHGTERVYSAEARAFRDAKSFDLKMASTAPIV